MKVQIHCNQCKAEFQGTKDDNRQCIYCHSFDLTLAPALAPVPPPAAAREILKAVPPDASISDSGLKDLKLWNPAIEQGIKIPVQNGTDQLLHLADALAEYLAHAPSDRFKGKIGKQIEERFDRVTAKIEQLLIGEVKL